jgi:hypothetical protein
VRPEKQLQWWENKTDFTANRVLLCAALHVAAKSDCSFASSKHNTHIKQKIHMTEIVQASSDYATE